MKATKYFVLALNLSLYLRVGYALKKFSIEKQLFLTFILNNSYKKKEISSVVVIKM